MKTLVTQVAEISETMANTMFASLAWSGATRAANGIIYDADVEDLTTFLSLASLASRVTVADIRPTTSQVMALLQAAPEQEVATPTAIKLLKEAGEDVSNLEETLKQDHELAIVRHKKQERRLKVNEAKITKALDAAFAKPSKTFPKLSDALTESLTAKIMQKVNARRSRLIVDISSGRNMVFAPKELAKINIFLKKQKAA